MTGHTPKNTPADHMIAFYRDLSEVRDEKFDGMIVTGAPVELLEFEDGVLLGGARQVLRLDASACAFDLLHLLGGAGGPLPPFTGSAKHRLRHKAFGVYRHRNLNPTSPYLRGFSDDFSIPVSRWTEVRRSELPPDAGLEVLMESDEAGLCLVADAPHRALYMFNHIEYDTATLAEEYWRDTNNGKPIRLPLQLLPA